MSGSKIMKKTRLLMITLISMAALSCQKASPSKIVIAHRGASAYLPEHTLESKAMAHAMGADYIEQDVALTRDNRAVVIHDHYLDTVSNVREVYPRRSRKDGRFYVIDFSLAELRRLTFFERINRDTGKVVYPKRFPAGRSIPFRIHTLEEEIEMIQGMNKSRGMNTGIYPELKAPRFHTDEGKDIAKIMLDILYRYGYKEKKDKCYLQCFDPACLEYLRNDLKCKLKMIQLIADNSWNETPGVDYQAMLTPGGLKKISTYADGVGPWTDLIVIPSKEKTKQTTYTVTDVVKNAHSLGLEVHPFTFRADSLPGRAKNFDDYLSIFVEKLDIDGFFTDFPDLGVSFLKTRGYRK